LADLDTLDPDQMLEGYLSAERGDPEPGENRGRAFWHGWRNRMIDYGELPSDDASAQLADELVSSGRLRTLFQQEQARTETPACETADAKDVGS
jgi:hypothetical protein